MSYYLKFSGMLTLRCVMISLLTVNDFRNGGEERLRAHHEWVNFCLRGALCTAGLQVFLQSSFVFTFDSTRCPKDFIVLRSIFMVQRPRRNPCTMTRLKFVYHILHETSFELWFLIKTCFFHLICFVFHSEPWAELCLSLFSVISWAEILVPFYGRFSPSWFYVVISVLNSCPVLTYHFLFLSGN